MGRGRRQRLGVDGAERLGDDLGEDQNQDRHDDAHEPDPGLAPDPRRLGADTRGPEGVGEGVERQDRREGADRCRPSSGAAPRRRPRRVPLAPRHASAARSGAPIRGSSTGTRARWRCPGRSGAMSCGFTLRSRHAARDRGSYRGSACQFPSSPMVHTRSATTGRWSEARRASPTRSALTDAHEGSGHTKIRSSRSMGAQLG